MDRNKHFDLNGGDQEVREVVDNDEYVNSPRPQRNCGLHPLIHTLLLFNPPQHIVACQREEKEAPTEYEGQWGLREVGQD